MLWELLTGRVLFGGETVTEVLAQVIQYTQHLRRLEPPHEINPSVPRSLSTVVAHFLAVDPDQRPVDAASAYAMLRACPDVRMADAPELAEFLAQRLPDRAPRRRITTSHEPARGPVTQQAMGAVTRSISAGATPMSGELSTSAPPRGSKFALVAAAGLVALVGAVVVALVASDEPARPGAGHGDAAVVEVAPPASFDAAPAATVPEYTTPHASASPDAGQAVDAGAPTVTQPDAGAVDKKRPRTKRSSSQIKEVQLGGEE
jgi:hypothetical protein